MVMFSCTGSRQRISSSLLNKEGEGRQPPSEEKQNLRRSLSLGDFAAWRLSLSRRLRRAAALSLSLPVRPGALGCAVSLTIATGMPRAGIWVRDPGATRARVVTMMHSRDPMNETVPHPERSPVPPVRELVVPAALDGARLDKALARLMPELSRARLKRAIDLGAVRVNGRRMPKGGTVADGDVVRVDTAQVADAPAVVTPGAPLRVVFENDQVVVVDKPAGQPTAPLRPGEVGTLVNAILGRYPELVPNGDAFVGHSAREPGIIHRLDTETSGAVIVARTTAAFEVLKAALKESRLDKRYLLVCAEHGLPDDGTIEFPLANHPKDQRRVYACIHPRDVMRYEPRPARTSYRVLKRLGPWALVEATVEKALRHQIRAHFPAIDHPLPGTHPYAGPPTPPLPRHLLH